MGIQGIAVELFDLALMLNFVSKTGHAVIQGHRRNFKTIHNMALRQQSGHVNELQFKRQIQIG